MDETTNGRRGGGTRLFHGTRRRDAHAEPRPDTGRPSDAGETVRISADELAHLRAEAGRARALALQLARSRHELRTPMQAVLGYGELIARGGELTAAQHAALRELVAAGHHLLDVLDETLADVPAPVDVVGVVEQALGIVVPRARDAGVSLEPVLAPPGPDRPAVLAVRRHLLQVLTNLLTNAVKFNRPGGRVSVVWTSTGCSPGGSTAGPPHLAISVHDTGPGIDPARQARLFRSYDRLGAEASGVEGEGLGLALCRELVEAMGGRIEVASTPGVGTTFTVTLPVAGPHTEPLAERPAERPAALLAAPAPSTTGAGARVAGSLVHVLNVEDNRANRELIDEVVEAAGRRRVTSTGSGRAALDLAHDDPPDVVLLDAHLPDASVAEVLRGLKADPVTASVPVVVLTADTSRALATHVRRLGAELCLSKPIDLDALVATIQLLTQPRPVTSIGRAP